MRSETVRAGIVLAGGRSSRMGTPKADLEWHGSTVLRHVVGIVARATRGPVVVVRAAGQRLPALPPGIEVLEDEHADRGPLEGIATGLAALADAAEVAFVATTDAPLLHPALVRCICAALDDGADVAMPDVGGRLYPLTAAYRTLLAPVLRAESDAGHLRVSALPGLCDTVTLGEGALLGDPQVAARDPELHSLLNVNTPEQYRAARARPAPAVIVDGRPEHAATLAVRAGTLVDGEPVLGDTELALATGDVVVRARA